MALLDLLMRDDLNSLPDVSPSGPGRPPNSLFQYIKDIRRFSLARTFTPAIPPKQAVLPRHVSLGMKTKKIHEVIHAASFMDRLATDVSQVSGHPITHLLDFGSGQNYLGRALASPPYSRHIVAVEGREVNMAGAKELDVMAGLAEREKVMRNKKVLQRVRDAVAAEDPDKVNDQDALVAAATRLGLSDEEIATIDLRRIREMGATYTAQEGMGLIHYVIGRLENADLTDVLARLEEKEAAIGSKIKREDLRILAMSIHSCGNLSHYGIKSLIANDAVKAVAIVGCCYNLMTEKLGPRTYKLPYMRPSLQPVNGRIKRESERCDPQGFPMSQRFSTHGGDGIRFNITARMMACQAPANWTEQESDGFFTRHFFRAILQKIFLDKGVISKVYYGDSQSENDTANHSPFNTSTNPVIIGSLPKRCYASLTAYVRGAIAKLTTHAEYGQYRDVIRATMGAMTDDEIGAYERTLGTPARKREISAVWSLMAFSAWVVESAIVTDRWLFLREHVPDTVRDCWVETLFDFAQSPRNLVVVGVKR